MTKERRLGRGLEALLGMPNEVGDAEHVPPALGAEPEPQPAAAEQPEGYLELNVYEVDANPYQPRQSFDEAEIESLAASIAQHGLLQPIVVRRQDQRYQLISGERRLRAAIKSGWTRVPAKVVDVEDRQVAELAIVENLQRKDLNPLEKALSFDQYLKRYECTQDDLAARLDIDRSTIANLIRLLELPAEVQDALRNGEITQGHARALLPLGDEDEQCQVCQQVCRESLSVRATEMVVQDLIRTADADPLSLVGGDASDEPRQRVRNDQLAMLEQEFRVALGTKVELRQTARGRGRIIVHFKNNAEFERLHDELCGAALQDSVRQAG
ncbi:MAG: ParB/RepB/Spo0J family partition protein [Planctomycetales bacterium]|nr:ParB/RepB/Spo0J family partition protein [Planctomycetales bacterium]